MSLLDELKTGIPDRSDFVTVSVKLNCEQRAIIDAVTKLRESKSDAIRFLIQLGWEAIENDPDFSDLVEHKEEVQRIFEEKAEEDEYNLGRY